jgi:hypothetical protein
MSESLTYGSVGGMVRQPLALLGTASRPEWRFLPKLNH